MTDIIRSNLKPETHASLYKLAEDRGCTIHELLEPLLREYALEHIHLARRYDIIYGDIHVYPLSSQTSMETPDV